jgi:hypothetical protein
MGKIRSIHMGHEKWKKYIWRTLKEEQRLDGNDIAMDIRHTGCDYTA